MSNKTVNTSVEILGKFYSIRCPESEQKSLQDAATYLNEKMLAIQEAGTAINLERIAIMAGLNIAYELMQHDQHRTSIMDKINSKINGLQDKLDTAINKAMQTEMLCTTD